MRVFVAVLVLIFSFQSFTKADGISEFEIEGMSIGDSALDFFTQSEIKNNSLDYYNDKSFTPVQNEYLSFFKKYDFVDFDFKTNDKDYIIHALYGSINYEKKNIDDCYKEMDEIVTIMKKLFKDNAEIQEKHVEKDPSHTGDPTGKSKGTHISFYFDNGDRASVTCYDYSKEDGGVDNLSVGMQTKEQNDFLYNKAYK